MPLDLTSAPPSGPSPRLSAMVSSVIACSRQTNRSPAFGARPSIWNTRAHSSKPASAGACSAHMRAMAGVTRNPSRA